MIDSNTDPRRVLLSGCHLPSKQASQGIANEDYDRYLPSLPVPVWQVRSRPSGGCASGFGGWDWLPGDIGCAQNCEGCSYPQGWQVCSLEKCVSPTSQAIFANPLSRQGRKVSSPFCQEGSRPSSFMGLSQEGEYIPFVRKDLSFQRAASYSRLMSWSETCQFQCCDLYLEFCLLKWQ